jgi:ParB family transcriptional regulator, chromosome partitioning protein
MSAYNFTIIFATSSHNVLPYTVPIQSCFSLTFTQPVIIDKHNSVVAGHGRILGAKKAGLKQVPKVCLEDLTEEQIKAYRLVDNKLNESEWDDVLLAQELEELDKEQMKLFGFVFVLCFLI